MKEYLLLIRKDEQSSPRLSEDKHKEFIEKCMVYINDLKKEGKLISVSENEIVVEEEIGKGKKKEVVQHIILKEEIKTTKVQVKF